MNAKYWIVILILLAGALLIVAAWPDRARADEAPACYPLESAIAAAEKKGGTEIALVDVAAAEADQILIAEVNGTIQLWPVKDGCMVLGPTPYLKAKADVRL